MCGFSGVVRCGVPPGGIHSEVSVGFLTLLYTDPVVQVMFYGGTNTSFRALSTAPCLPPPVYRSLPTAPCLLSSTISFVLSSAFVSCLSRACLVPFYIDCITHGVCYAGKRFYIELLFHLGFLACFFGLLWDMPTEQVRY